MINFPYAVSNFSLLREKNYLYLDRSAYIRELEAADRQILFLRPRRFGKSLFLSTLASYYDVDQADQFESLFGDLNIGQNPTEERNQYLILRWDFSKVSAQGDIEQIKRSLFNHLNRTIEAFQVHYQQYLKHPIYIDPEDGITSFESLLGVVGNSGYQLYLLIDEYDNFANEVLMHNQGDKQRYLAMLEGEGIVKTLFKVIKAGASEGPISRVFITGVSPMVMSDMTSGYNVVTNISLNNEFSSLCGITAPELRTLVEQVVDQDKSQIQPIMDTLRQFYNGYRFVPSEDSITLYNPILCFHFLRNYQKEQKPPRNLLDGNLAMDTGRIRYIAQLKGGQDMVDWALDEQNSASLPKLAEDFGIANLERARNDGDYMLSLLYYFGVLTLDGMDDFGSLKLKIPNLVVRGLYLEEIKRQALPDVAEEYD